MIFSFKDIFMFNLNTDLLDEFSGFQFTFFFTECVDIFLNSLFKWIPSH